MEPLRRLILLVPDEAISSRQVKSASEFTHPLVSTMFEVLVGPRSLRTVSLSPPSWYSKISVSVLTPEHLRKPPASMPSISILKYAIGWWSSRLPVPAMPAPGSQGRTVPEQGSAYHDRAVCRYTYTGASRWPRRPRPLLRRRPAP